MEPIQSVSLGTIQKYIIKKTRPVTKSTDVVSDKMFIGNLINEFANHPEISQENRAPQSKTIVNMRGIKHMNIKYLAAAFVWLLNKGDNPVVTKQNFSDQNTLKILKRLKTNPKREDYMQLLTYVHRIIDYRKYQIEQLTPYTGEDDEELEED